MYEHVSGQHRLLGKRSFANIALVRSVAGVGPFVGGGMRSSGKSTGTVPGGGVKGKEG